MQSSSISTAGAAGGASGAAVILLVWGLSLAHVTMPAEVAAAAMMLLTPVIHYTAVRLGVEPDPKVVAIDASTPIIPAVKVPA
jgi:hypothetical protein